jgi:presqualene diphosphate synthase
MMASTLHDVSSVARSPTARAPTGDRPVARSSSFYAAMRILPRTQRQAMYEVYAFCRAVDDIADDRGPRPDRMDALERWREDLGRLYSGQGATDLTHGLARPIASFDLRLEDFLAVIDGMQTDVAADVRAPDWATLDLYCDQVASAVGRLSVRIFGVDESNGPQLAHHLGRALQITNILRDLDEDADMGRLYLPSEALAAAGITTRDIGAVLSHPALGQACLLVAERARRHFAEAHAVSQRCRRAAVRSPRLMASVYRAILEKLIARGWAAPRASVRPSRSQLLWPILRHGFL